MTFRVGMKIFQAGIGCVCVRGVKLNHGDGPNISR